MEQLIEQLCCKEEQLVLNALQQLRFDVVKQQVICRNLITPKFDEIQENLILYLNNQELLRYFVQWLANFITGNQNNKTFIMKHLINPTLIQFLENVTDPKIGKIELIFINGILGVFEEKQHMLFTSQFSQFIKSRLQHYFDNQIEEHFEWTTYIMISIFDHTLEKSYLKYLTLTTPLVEYLFQIFSKTIDDKVYPTLIKNMNPPNQDINEMYNNNKKNLGLQISLEDLEYMFQYFTGVNEQLSEFKLWSLFTFMGGYNVKILDLFFNKFIQAIQLLQTVGDNLELISVLLRFISNMVHLNEQVWVYLNSHFEYIPIILGFSKKYPINNCHQLREWTIIISKNLCDYEQFRQFINNQL